MKRKIDVINNPNVLNPWVKRSIELFEKTAYLDNIHQVYPFKISKSKEITDTVRREIIQSHQSRNTKKLINLLKSQTKFPYDDPIWYLLKTVKNGLTNNPKQIQRIAKNLYSLTADETVARLESPPKSNQQSGSMFSNWMRKKFRFIGPNKFKSSRNGIFMLDASEENGKQFVINILKQKIEKRPDLIVKVNTQYIIGEAKWIGQSGGNQGKAVTEVLLFCKGQRGSVKRIGIVDGCSWATYNVNGYLLNNKEQVLIQESESDILSALQLQKYLDQLSSI